MDCTNNDSTNGGLGYLSIVTNLGRAFEAHSTKNQSCAWDYREILACFVDSVGLYRESQLILRQKN